MALKRTYHREDGALSPSVEALMSLARSAESRPEQAWPGTAKTGEGWNAGRVSWQPTKGPRAWADKQQYWSDWRSDGRRERDGWCQSDWQWNSWYSREAIYEDTTGHGTGSRVAGGQGVDRCWRQSTWCWDDYIVRKGSTIRVELSGAELGDADLADLVSHLGSSMQQYMQGTDGKYILNIDLSCNLYISDDGIIDHLAPFLKEWPVCHRLKLYKTSIGDGALGALSSWAAGGYAHELHFSDLGGQVTGDGVFDFLNEVQQKGKYPYLTPDGIRCALWLRLEHNAVPNTDKLVNRALSQGMSLSVLQKPDLGQVRPGTPSSLSAKDEPAVNLVLFHKQDLRVSRQWLGSMVRMAPVSPELQKIVCACNGAAADASRDGKSHGPALWEQFLGPSQRGGRKPGARRGAADAAEEDGEDGATRLNRAFSTVLACPTSGDDKVLGRWRCHLESASDPEGEARRILRMTAKLCDSGYIENGASDSSRTLSPPAALSDATSSGSSSDPVALDGAAHFAEKPEGEDSNDEAGACLAYGPPVAAPAACALVAAPLRQASAT
mmetsp:Transcript_38268/g.110530  ORF Transcript_38268/g.110530 Transcript_38268/m.110530 type:complete len:553 (+) Transcript_38268:80-1738(+)